MADKWTFVAIDSNGRILRGVLRADSPEDARERLLAENAFAKQLDPAPDDAPITWAPKGNRRSSVSTEKVLHRVPTWLRRGEWRGEGIFIVTAGSVRFEGPGEPVHLTAGDVERVLLRGWPKRVLEVQLVTQDLLEFDAGFVSTHPAFADACRLLSER